MKTTEQKMDSCHKLIKMIEAEETHLRTCIARKKLTYRGRYTNLAGYHSFFKEHDLQREAAAVEFDLSIVEKAIGKRNLKSL